MVDMKNWEVVAEAVAFGIVGIQLEKSVTVPFSSGSTQGDQLIDIGIGLLGAFLGAKYIGNKPLGVAVVAGGLGWAGSAGASALGFTF